MAGHHERLHAVASRVGDQFLAHVRFVTLVSIAGPSAEISLPESEWHLMLPVE